jgi:hypothetical protein
MDQLGCVLPLWPALPDTLRPASGQSAFGSSAVERRTSIIDHAADDPSHQQDLFETERVRSLLDQLLEGLATLYPKRGLQKPARLRRQAAQLRAVQCHAPTGSKAGLGHAASAAAAREVGSRRKTPGRW